MSSCMYTYTLHHVYIIKNKLGTKKQTLVPKRDEKSKRENYQQIYLQKKNVYGRICAGATAEVIDPVPAVADSERLYLPLLARGKGLENTYDDFKSFRGADYYDIKVTDVCVRRGAYD